jgi:hypothetical protein
VLHGRSAVLQDTQAGDVSELMVNIAAIKLGCVHAPACSTTSLT